MTVRATPRLRIALLDWFLDSNEPLAGDLVEECAHRSRTWFWFNLDRFCSNGTSTAD